jgi:excisionase family DNA binding protein
MTTSTDLHGQGTSAANGVPRLLPLLSVEDAATYLGVSPRWVYTQVRSGRLPAMLIARSWRIRPEAVEGFAESFQTSGEAS